MALQSTLLARHPNGLVDMMLTNGRVMDTKYSSKLTFTLTYKSSTKVQNPWQRSYKDKHLKRFTVKDVRTFNIPDDFYQLARLKLFRRSSR